MAHVSELARFRSPPRCLLLLVPALTAFVACGADDPSAAAVAGAAAPVEDGGAEPAPSTVVEGVTVNARDVARGFEGVRVLFHDASGAVVADEVTDAEGRTKSPPGIVPAMVTVVAVRSFGEIALPVMVTFTGVVDGDTLTVKPRTPGSSDEPSGQYRAILPPNPPADTRKVIAEASGGTDPCIGEGAPGDTSLTIQLDKTCVAATNVVLLRTVPTDEAAAPLYAIRRNVAQPAALSPAVDVDFTTPPVAWSPGVRATFAITNPPPGAQAVPGRLFVQIVDDTAFAPDEDDGLSYFVASGVDALQASLSIGSRIGETWASIRGITHREAPGRTPTLDFGTVLPDLAIPTVDATDRQRPVVSLDPKITETDGGWVRLSFRPTPSLENQTGAPANWMFVVSPTTGSFKVPALPADLQALAPVSDVAVDTQTFVESTLLEGYGALKALPTGVDKVGFGTILPANGVLRTTGGSPVPRPEPGKE